MKMKRGRRLMLPLLTCCLVTSCAVGNFCDVVQAPLTFDRSVSALMVERNRGEAERIYAQNAYGNQHCDW